MTDRSGSETTVHATLARLGTDNFLLQGRELEAELDHLRQATGTEAVTPWPDQLPGAYEEATLALPAVRAALDDVQAAEQRLPELEARYDAARKAANGPRVLLGILGLIVLAVLIGQLF